MKYTLYTPTSPTYLPTHVCQESSEGAAAATVFGFQRMSRAEAAAANKLKGGAADEEEEEEEEQPRGLLAGEMDG